VDSKKNRGDWQEPALAGAYNFGPKPGEVATVRDVVEMARKSYGGGEVQFAATSEGPHEARTRVLEIAKARALLGVRPLRSLAEAVQHTMAWYRAQHGGGDARELCEAEIAAYEAAGCPA
jgi:CDP-glucose 4,6-dehydratase